LRSHSPRALFVVVTMGNSSARQDHMAKVEAKVGKVQLSGRYHRLPKKIEDDYDVTNKVLGTGYNGVVRMGMNKVNQKQKVAVKAFKLSAVHGDKRAQLESEVEIFLCMDHPHVTRLFDVYETGENLYLVMECMEGGELFDRVNELKQFSEKDAADVTWQMLLAINYIHSHGMVHRDLKLENFLYDLKGSSHLKLIDFGFSHVWDPNIKMHVSCGTLSYVAPEVLEKSYTSKCDLWSLGVVVFILLAGYMPFSGNETVQTKNITSGNYRFKPERWKHVSEQGKDFVKKLLQVSPTKRLDAQSALDDPWIANRHRVTQAPDKAVVDALRSFGQASKFRRCCMEMMAWSLSNEERAKVREYFISMDQNHHGTISLVELKKVLTEKFHISDAETRGIFEALDSNNDEEIHYSDFLAAMVSTRIAVHDDLLLMAFKKFDTDSSGYITVENMREVLGENFEGQQVQELMKEADFTQDGRISYAEFCSYIRQTPLEAHRDAAGKVVDNMLKRGNTGDYAKGVPDKIVKKASDTGNQASKEKEKQPKCGCTLM